MHCNRHQHDIIRFNHHQIYTHTHSLSLPIYFHLLSTITYLLTHIIIKPPVSSTSDLIKLVIDDAIEVYLKNKNILTSLRSAHETSESVYKFYKQNGLYWYPIVDGMDTNLPRQSYPKTYSPNGYIDIVNPQVFMNSDSFYGDKIYSFITDKTYEIDTIDDFNYIEYILTKKHA